MSLIQNIDRAAVSAPRKKENRIRNSVFAVPFSSSSFVSVMLPREARAGSFFPSATVSFLFSCLVRNCCCKYVRVYVQKILRILNLSCSIAQAGLAWQCGHAMVYCFRKRRQYLLLRASSVPSCHTSSYTAGSSYLYILLVCIYILCTILVWV